MVTCYIMKLDRSLMNYMPTPSKPRDCAPAQKQEKESPEPKALSKTQSFKSENEHQDSQTKHVQSQRKNEDISHNKPSYLKDGTDCTNNSQQPHQRNVSVCKDHTKEKIK